MRQPFVSKIKFQEKRCGHRPGKAIVQTGEMVDRIKAAVDARVDDSFVVMARTDAIANEGIEPALERTRAYVEAGADAVFPEAIGDLAIPAVCRGTERPVLANITEFSMTPLFSREQLREVNVAMILYPLSAFRAMSRAALRVYDAILKDGTHAHVVSDMQPRAELFYERLGYHEYEERLDRLFAQ